MDIKVKEKTRSRFLNLRVSAYWEIASFFVFMMILAFLCGIPFNYFKVSPHPFWIIVILMAAQYGTNEALLAASIATVILFLGPLPARSILEQRYEYFFVLAKVPLLWFVSAVALGELRMKHIAEKNELQKDLLEATGKEKQIAEAYLSLKKIKEHLELHVASEMQTVLMGIRAIKELQENNKESVIKGSCDLIINLISPEKFSIYFLENLELIQVAKYGWKDSDVYVKRFSSNEPLFQEVIGKRNVVSIQTTATDILGKEGVLAIPIMAKKTDQVVGMIKIEQVPFIRLKTPIIESLRVIGEWIGESYENIVPKEASDGK